MKTQLARKTAAIARPLKLLIPMIAEELKAGDTAGLEHYRQAGDLLREARDQVAHFKWGAWLSQNFTLSRTTAERYMRFAEEIERKGGRVARDATLYEVIGERKSDSSFRRGNHAPIRDFTSSVDADHLGQAPQTAHDEIRLHRELALELVDIGFKALATRLHPDRGGSKDAMRRLNRVRDELKAVATSRRFV